MEGFTISTSDDNMFMWNVGIYGPPETLYQVIFCYSDFIRLVFQFSQIVLFLFSSNVVSFFYFKIPDFSEHIQIF